jgi:hypothetical protein
MAMSGLHAASDPDIGRMEKEHVARFFFVYLVLALEASSGIPHWCRLGFSMESGFGDETGTQRCVYQENSKRERILAPDKECEGDMRSDEDCAVSDCDCRP